MKSKSKAKAVAFKITELQKGAYHPFVKVQIEGIKCNFLIDTGASKSVIDKTFYEKKLRRKMKVIKQETTGLHSTVNKSFEGVLKKLKIGSTSIKDYSISGIDLSHVNNVYVKNKIDMIDGILGSDILFDFGAVIDYKKSKLFI